MASDKEEDERRLINFRGRLLQGIVLVSVLTSAVYVITYVYESAYLMHFGIPIRKKVVDLNSMISAGFLWTFIVLGWFTLFSYGIYFLGYLDDYLYYKKGGILTAFLALSPPLIAFGVWAEMGAYALALVVFLTFIVVWSATNYAESRSYISISISALCTFVIIGLISSAISGYVAETKEEYNVISTGEKEMVEVRSYTDRIIVAEFDRESQTVGPTFRVYTMGEISGKEMRLEEVGPLTPARQEASEWLID